LVDRGSYAFCVASTTRKHRKENWNKPIRNPDKPTRRSDEGGSGTPLAATMQSLVWGEDYPSGAERGNLRSSAHRVNATINMDDLPCGFAKPIR
jgi:hypothetical protein